LRNASGRAIVHLAMATQAGGGERPNGTGLLRHVAFTCSDYARWRERIDAMGLPCEVNDYPEARLRQLFMMDPDGIRLEFNFHAMPERRSPPERAADARL
jgi:hypothetical protein